MKQNYVAGGKGCYNGELPETIIIYTTGHSILLWANGDFIAEHFYLDAKHGMMGHLLCNKPHFTDYWLMYVQQSAFTSL